jgi:hypothetical protein
MGGFLHDPRLLYCPCHRGEHEYERYEPQINRPWLDPEYGTPAYGNYQYRGHLGADGKPVRRVMDGERLIAADGFRTRADFNHVRGTNRLWGDMHVDWRVDADGILFKTIPSGFSLTTSATVYSDLWTAIESNGISH